MSHELALVMPMYNEEGCAARVVQSWLTTLTDLKVDFLMIILDDGSTDSTAQVLDTFADNPRVRIIHQANAGHGPTILQGYRQAARLADWVFQCDGDDETPSAAFRPLWERRTEYDAVLGFRCERQQSWGRSLLSRCSRLSVRLLFGAGVRDVNVPYRLVRASVLEPIVERIAAETFAPNVLISGALIRTGARICNTPVSCQQRQSGCSIRPWKLFKGAWRSFTDTLRYARATASGRDDVRSGDPRPNAVKLFFVFLCFLLFATCMVNLNGGDWDGTQIALGSFFPDAAQAGYIGLYNRPWQPLTYAILGMAHRVTGSPEIAMFLPALLGSAGIGLLLASMARLSRDRLSTVTLVGIILLIPEFLFGSVYMNSTVFGFSLAALALWMACPDWSASPTSTHGVARNFLVGVSLALAVLCRFDFVLVYPMFLLLLACGRAQHLGRNVLALGLGSAAVLLPALAMDVMEPLALLERFAIHRSALGAAGRFHRPASERLVQAAVGVNPVAWLIGGVAAGLFLARAVRRRAWMTLLVIGPTAVLLYPMLSTTTPKYLVPFDLFLAVFLAWSLSEIVPERIARHRASTWALALAVLLACFVPAHLTARPPFFRPTMNAAVSTDDGPRAFFGYAQALRHQSTRLGPPHWLETLLADPKDLLLVAPFDGWLAGSLSQRIVMHVVRNGRDTRIGPGTVSARYAGKQLVIAEPNQVPASFALHFAAKGRTPIQVAMPHSFTAPEVRVLRLLSRGDLTGTQLQEQAQLEAGVFQTALTRLRWGEVIESPAPGRYRLKYRMQALDSDPNQGASLHRSLPGGRLYE
ncbi:MAG: glycosyltransferase [Phycisphaerales bacterium]|nr:MAG: glycosyltransferase [Phycisphaerales bacterium]